MARRSPAASSQAPPQSKPESKSKPKPKAATKPTPPAKVEPAPKPDRSPTPKAKPGRKAAPPAPAPLRVLMIASEVAPFSKTGGLADVTAALPRALAREGHDVTVVTPRYQGITAGQWRAEVQASMAGVTLAAGLFEEPLGPGARALFVDCPPLYQRAGLYNSGQVDYQDNPLRFAFLAIAALEWAAAAEQPVSVVHAHDWQAGLAPAYLRQYFAGHPVLGQLPSVFTIHNLAYQGLADKTWVPRLGLGWDLFTPDGLEYFDRLSLLKAGINFSDAVTTVSPTYAAEIQRPEQGFGFDGIIRGRREVLSGILNGVDVDTWDPAHDPYLPQPYTAQTLEGKAAAKAALLEAAGLPGGDDGMRRPLVGIVSRLADQKGFDLVAQVAASLADLGAAFVVLGSGEARYEAMWRTLATSRPDRFAVRIGFDEPLAHLIEGGADMFLMPSRYEPCGLNQMYSLRYGTVPVVRATGGLADSVVPWDPATGTGTGFLFAEYSGDAMLAALAAAVRVFADPEQWLRLQQNGMAADFSWDRAAREYVTVYKRVIAAKRGRGPSAGSRLAGNQAG